MHRLFGPILQPLLDVLQPRTIVEVGTGQGLLSRRLLEHCPEAVVHSVDPEPDCDPAAVGAAHPGRFFFHSGTSDAVLGSLPAPDIAILDGDPNFHTVLAELRLFDDAAEAAGEAAPVVVVHHVDWPFGTRDGYWAPGRLAKAAVNEPREGGVRPGHREVSGDGLRLVPYVAATDLGPANGVRRAVDSFVRERGSWRRVDIPGVHGTAVLAPIARLSAIPRLGRLLDEFEALPFMVAHARRLERERVNAILREDTGPSAEPLSVPDYRRVLAERDAAQELAHATAKELQALRDETAESGEVVSASYVDDERQVPVHDRDLLIHAAAHARGELDATVRELARAVRALEAASSRAHAAEAQRDAAVARLEELQSESAGSAADLRALQSRFDELSEAHELAKTDGRRAREESARLASEVEHAQAHVASARRALEQLLEAGSVSRWQRVTRAWRHLRLSRGANARALERALEVLGSAEADVPGSDAVDRVRPPSG